MKKQDPAYYRSYYEANRERILARAHRYYRKNRGRILTGLRAPSPQPHVAGDFGLTAAECGYFAGFIDGEGCISTTNAQKYLSVSLKLMVCCTDVSPLRRMQRSFGGRLYVRHSGTRAMHKPLWQWVASGNLAKDVLRCLRPYLDVKAAEADIALEFPIGFRGHAISEDMRQAQRGASRALRELKRRNIPAAAA